MQQKSFGQFLREAGMTPPDMNTSEYDEQQILREEMEAMKNPLEDKYDHKED